MDQLSTLVLGTTTCLSHHDGSITPESWAGLLHRDIRTLSRLSYRLDGSPLLVGYRCGHGPTAEERAGPVGPKLHPASRGMWRCHRAIEGGLDDGELVDRLELRSLDNNPLLVELVVEMETDFADLLVLRYGRPRSAAVRPQPVGPDRLRAVGDQSGLDVVADPAPTAVAPGRLVWKLQASPGVPALATIRYQPSFRSSPAPSRRQGPAGPTPTTAPRTTRPPAPPPPLRVESSLAALAPTVAAGLADLAALTVDAPDLGLRFVAAGTPWFTAFYGRDSLLTGWQALVASQEPARLALTGLAQHQGRQDNPTTGEQPGRLPHEMRIGGTSPFGLPPGAPFYGSIDANPLFVMLLAEAHRWGADPSWVRGLLPAARAAVAWCRDQADLDGDGYIEDHPAPPGAGPLQLPGQTWKDSLASTDVGRSRSRSEDEPAVPAAPIEVQAYLWAAYVALADLEVRLGDPAAAPPLRRAAHDLRRALLRDFWHPADGTLALTLGNGRLPSDVVGSNVAHCLWTGILPTDVAAAVAARLRRDDARSGWGLRTLATTAPGYNPLSYHAGSVWPHDTALAVAGLAHYGLGEDALELSRQLLDAAVHFDHRLPEVFAGLGRDELDRPLPYPLACRPQAWSAAAPLLVLRSLLGLQPDIPAGRVVVGSLLPSGTTLAVDGICLGEAGTISLTVDGPDVVAASLPEGVELVSWPWPRAQ